jgi:hypothetical protein
MGRFACAQHVPPARYEDQDKMVLTVKNKYFHII